MRRAQLLHKHKLLRCIPSPLQIGAASRVSTSEGLPLAFAHPPDPPGSPEPRSIPLRRRAIDPLSLPSTSARIGGRRTRGGASAANGRARRRRAARIGEAPPLGGTGGERRRRRGEIGWAACPPRSAPGSLRELRRLPSASDPGR